MSSPYGDLGRPPLSQPALLRTPRRESALWADLQVLPETGSTNADVADAARAGRPEGLVVVAEQQVSGRGRLDRQWVSPARSGLTFSMLLRPQVEPSRLPLLTLLVATAAAVAAIQRTDCDVRLKWPNDLVVDDRKLAGLLAEVVGDAVVIGLGMNVSTRADELPRDDATSLEIERGQPVDRAPLLLAVLRSVESAYLGWLDTGADPEVVLAPYRVLSATLGRTVRAQLPDGATLVGEAVDVGRYGQLLVDVEGERHALSAADVVHLRPL